MSIPTPHQLFIINDSLSNDEHSTDEEMVENLIANGIDQAVANKVVRFRDVFFVNPRAVLVVGDDGELGVSEIGAVRMRICTDEDNTCRMTL